MKDRDAKPSREKLDYRSLIRLYRVFWRHYRKYWKLLVAVNVGLVLNAALHLLLPWPLKLILDGVILRDQEMEGLGLLDRWSQGDSAWLLLALVLAFVVLRILASLVSYFYRLSRVTAAERIAADIRDHLFANLQTLSLSFHNTTRSGDLVYRLTSDLDGMKGILIEAPQKLLNRFVMICAYTGMMLFLEWRLALIATAVIPVLGWLHWHLGGRVRSATKQKKRKESDVSSILAENVTAIALVQAYGREDLQRTRFESENRESLRHGIDTIRLTRSFRRISGLLCALCTAGVLYYGGILALEGDLLPGTLVLFATYLKNLYTPIEKLAKTMLTFANSQVSGERILELVECDMVMTDAPDATTLPPVPGPIEFSQVSFGYLPGHEVLRDVSFTVEPGETIALVGPSGSGKSTLMRLLLRFFDPQQGGIFIDGHDLREVTLRSLRDAITVVLQDAKLFNKTVRENIAFGRVGATDEEIVRAAEMAQAHDFILRMEEGYDTMISEGGENLSGGQKQRINIARGIVRSTPILILDEPTTALDGRTERLLQEALRELTKGKTTFLIAHRFCTIIDADRILLLGDGKVAAYAPHDELLRTSPEYQRLCELQSGSGVAAMEGLSGASRGASTIESTP